ncbi:hypothetical protein [Vibrio sp. CAU 1672]|uniref:hypothetical protein n=1 Tax=Vibrio sp. CAU 1672 TaxID=3032594 RepID=UPI0023DC61AB|nr:hypothetical protein [Vibrio sp. CAU 1672]MDF2152233.1 hypothetical protein [Vibrio sp. CAU 1672]
MDRREQKYIYWKEERKKGKWHYIIKSFLMISCALIIGRLIGLAIFDKLDSYQEIMSMLPIDAVLLILIGLPISFACWHHEESKFFRALKRRSKQKHPHT